MKSLYLYTICLLSLLNNLSAQVNGCTDPLASNFNSSATQNDGTCIYNTASVSSLSSFYLDSLLSETSGLINWNNQIWTHNDNGDINIYSLDTLNGNIIQSYSLSGVLNNDWEEISQDSAYIYLGDFGNNVSGNRTDLKILRIKKSSILNNAAIIDTISFSYSDQTNFTPTSPGNTDFDCEAFIVSNDSIYLFTKQWISNKTGIYSLPKVPGIYVANLKATLNVGGMSTGATYLESQRLIAVCGYSNLLQPFVYLLYDFQGSDFLTGNKRKIDVSLPFHQVEAIATSNGFKYYLSNEAFVQAPFNTPQKLHVFDLSTFLAPYLNDLLLTVSADETKNKIIIYPNPVKDLLAIETESLISDYFLMNTLGQVMMTGKLKKGRSMINCSDLVDGMYFLKVGQVNGSLFRVIKK